jgi:CRISPR-associated protein Cas1
MIQGRIVELQQPGVVLSKERGCLTVQKDGETLGVIPLDDLASVLFTGFGQIISTQALLALIERNVSVIFCSENYHPAGLLLSCVGNVEQAGRLQRQVKLSTPFKKRAWQLLVQAKLLNQSRVLEKFGVDGSKIRALSARVRSGDPNNIEAQAAREYWQKLFGSDFLRNTDQKGVNSFLNYGYAVVRAAVARALVASGLNPALGIHHQQSRNAFALADDFIEPFRPYVDETVRSLGDTQNLVELMPEHKRALAQIIQTDQPTADGVTPLALCILRLAQSFVRSIESGKLALEFPLEISP